jgi:predicted transcriptional regulator
MRILPTSAQIVAARALLLLEQRKLAELAKVHVSTLVRLEGAGWETAWNARASSSSNSACASPKRPHR